MRCSLKYKLLFISFIFFIACSSPNESPNYLSLNGKWNLIYPDDQGIQDPYNTNKVNFKDIINLPSYEVILPHKGWNKVITTQKLTRPVTKTIWVWKKFYLQEKPKYILGLYLGMIRSIDRTYINGILVGSTGSSKPVINQAFDKRRSYLVSPSNLKQGENIIVIQITDPNENFKPNIFADDIFFSDQEKLFNWFFQGHLFSMIVCLLCWVTGLYFLVFSKTILSLDEVKYFGLGSFFLGIYLFFYQDIKYLFWDHFLAMKKFEYSSLNAFPILFAGYLFSLYKIPKKLSFQILLVLSIGLYLANMIPAMPQSSMFRLLRMSQFLIMFIMLYSMYICVKSLPKLFRKSDVYLFLSYLFLNISGFIDIFSNIGIINLVPMFPLGATAYIFFNGLLLNTKLNSFKNSLQKQSVRLSELAGHTLYAKSFKEFIHSYFNLIKNKLKYQNIAIEVIDHKEKKFFLFSQKKLSELSKISEPQTTKITLLEEEGSNRGGVNRKEQKRKNTTNTFFIPLYSLDKKKSPRGRIIIDLDSGENPIKEQHIRIFDILQSVACVHIKNLDYKLELNALNKALEQKVTQRTKEVRDQFTELQKVQASQTKFFAGITHDIKTPLSLITIPIDNLLNSLNSGNNSNNHKNIEENTRTRGGATALRRDSFSLGEKNTLHKIKYNVYRVVQMINSVLDIAKLELNQIRTELISGDMTAFIKRICELYQETFSAYDLTLIKKIENKKHIVNFDSEKIEKVMDNLLNNAIKHSSPKSKVFLNMKKINENFLEIKLKNIGVGLSSKERKIIFKPFYQVYDEKGISNRGTGLGLSISKKYIEDHHGKIWVHSKPNEFTEFIIRLPLAKSKNSKNNDKEISSNYAQNKELYPTLQTREMARSYREIKSEPEGLGLNQQTNNHRIFCVLLDDKKHWAEMIKALQAKFVVDIAKKWELNTLKKKQIKNPAQYISCLLIVKDLEKKHLSYIREIKSDTFLKYLPVTVIMQNDPNHLKTISITEGAEHSLTEPIHPLELSLKHENFAKEQMVRLESFRNDLFKEYLKNTYDLLDRKFSSDKIDNKINQNLLPNSNSNNKYFVRTLSCLDGGELSFIFFQDNSTYTRSDHLESNDHLYFFDMILLASLQKNTYTTKSYRSREYEIKPEAVLQDICYVIPSIYQKEPKMCCYYLNEDKKQLKYANIGLSDIYYKTDQKKSTFKKTGSLTKPESIKTNKIQSQTPIEVILDN